MPISNQYLSDSTRRLSVFYDAIKDKLTMAEQNELWSLVGNFSRMSVDRSSAVETSVSIVPDDCPVSEGEYTQNMLEGVSDWLISRSTTGWAERFGYTRLMEDWGQFLKALRVRVGGSSVEPTSNDPTCTVCGEHANEHLAIPHQFMPGGQAQSKASGPLPERMCQCQEGECILSQRAWPGIRCRAVNGTKEHG